MLLRYDPFDLSRIQVWYDGKQWADATVVDLSRPYDRRVKPEAAIFSEEADGQLSFLELAEQKRQQAFEKDPITYARVKGGDRS